MKNYLALFLALGLGIFIAITAAERSSKKLFWGDESNEIIANCDRSLALMFLDGAGGQASPNPLYYAIQKLNLDSVSEFGADTLVKYRRVSIVTAFLLIFGLFYFLSQHLSLPIACIGCAALLQSSYYHYYAAENRPYMLWLLLFFAWTAWIGRFTGRLTEFNSKNFWGTFTLAVLSVLLTNAGLVQVAFGLAAIVFIVALRNGFHRASFVATFKFIAPTLLVTGLLGIFYALRSANYPTIGEYDLLHTRNFELVRGVMRMLIAKGSIWLMVETLFVLFALAYPFIKFRKNPSAVLSLPNFPLWNSVIFQLLAFLVLAILVTVRHYFFIQRVFLFLIICRALLVAIGFYWAIYLAPKQEKFKRTIAGTLAVFAIAAAGHFFYLEREEWKKPLVFVEAPENSCANPVWQHPIQFVYKFLRVTTIPLNMIARVAQKQELCRESNSLSGSQAKEVRYLVLRDDNALTSPLELTTEIPTDFAEYHLCGKPLVLH